MVRKLRKPSKRMPLRQRYNIQARINEAKRKIRRDAKKHKLRRSRRPAPLVIPNAFPGKEEILQEYIRDMTRHQEEKRRASSLAEKDDEELTGGATTGSFDSVLFGASARATDSAEGAVGGAGGLLSGIAVPPSFPAGTHPTSVLLLVPSGQEAPAGLPVPALCIREGPEDGSDPLTLDARAAQTREHLAHEAQLARRCRDFLREHSDCSARGSRPCAYVVAPTLRTLQALVDAVARRRVPEVQQCAARGRSVAVDVGVGLLLCAVRR